MKKLVTYLFAPALLLFCTASYSHGQRLMVPDYFNCDRNLVTSWTGVASKYTRTDRSLSLEVATDADTVESIQFHYASPDELRTRLYINGRKFSEDDWDKIETAKGALIEGTRLTVWLCGDNATKALINWEPLQE